MSNGYIGRSPSDSSVIIAREKFTPSESTTEFTFAANYDIGYLDAYLNGARLIDGSDYTATDGRTVVLTSAASDGDVLELIAYKAFTINNVSASSGDFLVGGQLTVTGLSTVADVYSTGIITASSFSGDGSELTGVAGGKFASNDVGINTNTSVGIGTTNTTAAVSIANTAVLAVGIVTAYTSYIDALNITGLSTFSAQVDANGSLDVAGIITATSGLRATAGGINVIAGVSTFANQIDANGSVDITGIVTASHGARVTAGGINVIAGVSTFANQIDANGSVDVAGIVTASHGLRATTGGINVIAGVSTFANQIDANGCIDATGIVTASHGVRATAGGLHVVAGVSTFGSDVTISGVLTYEDVRNVDALGIVTARNGFRATAGGINVVSGVSTFANQVDANGCVDITGIVTASHGSRITAGGINIVSGVSTFANQINAGGCIDATAGIITASHGFRATTGGANLVGVVSATSFVGDGSALTNLPSAGLTTEAFVVTTDGLVNLNLSSAQDHKVTSLGITTITCNGGTEAESHTLRLVSSGVSTVGFSTYFLWPDGSAPNLHDMADGAIQLISFTVQRVASPTAGITTQLLAGASLSFS